MLATIFAIKNTIIILVVGTMLLFLIDRKKK